LAIRDVDAVDGLPPTLSATRYREKSGESMKAGLLESLRAWKNRPWFLWPQNAIILLYHRIAKLNSDPQLLCVSPKHFEEHLEILSRRYNPCSLEQLATNLKDNKVPRRSVVITFDDGYADNLLNAKPLLEAYDLPATIFVSTSFIDTDKEFWWDYLERLLFMPCTLPKNLTTNVDGKELLLEIGGHSNLTAEDLNKYRSWNVLNEYDPTPRHQLYRKLCELLRPLREEPRLDFLNQLSPFLGAINEARPSHLTLRIHELRQLAQGHLIQIGAHSATHSVLANLSGEELRSEIRHSKRKLEEILDRQVTTFSYPYGSASDYNAETKAEVHSAGFICACANVAGKVSKSANRWELPRFIVRDWPGTKFERLLKGWFLE
jgi:peptidoglycan/xylan/chitin deacetylase (PgdA/CDA1 family)